MMKPFVLFVNDEPVHAFVAPDWHAAGAVVRSMVERTLYGYRTQAVIASLTPNMQVPEIPTIVRSIEDRGLKLFLMDPELGAMTTGEIDDMLDFDSLVEDTYLFAGKLKGGELFG